MITMFQSIGVSIGPLIAGYIYDTTRFYDLAFNIILILIVVAIIFIFLVSVLLFNYYSNVGVESVVLEHLF